MGPKSAPPYAVRYHQLHPSHHHPHPSHHHIHSSHHHPNPSHHHIHSSHHHPNPSHHHPHPSHHHLHPSHHHPHPSQMQQPLWCVLADYHAEESGTLTVFKDDLVEVFDTSRNEWCLVQPVGREDEEGWVPASYLKPYSGGGFGELHHNPSLLTPPSSPSPLTPHSLPLPPHLHPSLLTLHPPSSLFTPHSPHSTAYPFPRFPPHLSPDDSDEALSDISDEPLPPCLSPEVTLEPYPDEERRTDAAKNRT